MEAGIPTGVLVGAITLLGELFYYAVWEKERASDDVADLLAK
jgi:hypothetical protein